MLLDACFSVYAHNAINLLNCPFLQGFSFQIGYCETDDQLPGRSIPQYTLYLVVANEKERLDWIRAIRAGKWIYFSIFCVFVGRIEDPVVI